MRWLPGVLFLVAIGCGGLVEPTESDEPGTRRTAGVPNDELVPGRRTSPPPKGPPPPAGVLVPAQPPPPPPPLFRDASAPPPAAVHCQVFEPGGPERWGCNTIGLVPELACEHPAGEVVAHCNCGGMFGKPSPGAPGADLPWYDVPADETMFTSSRMFQLWNKLCN